MYRDTETGELVTMDELRQDFAELVEQGEHEANDFEAWLDDCLSKNGFLEMFDENERNLDYLEAVDELTEAIERRYQDELAYDRWLNGHHWDE